MRNLKDNFKELVVEQCARKVKEAVASDTIFEVASEKREIRLALIHATIDHVHDVFGGVGRPKLNDMRIVANELCFIYPAMFKYDSGAKGYGLGGKKGSDGLANQLLDFYRARQGPRCRNDTGETEKVKKGKRTYQYGVDNDKWYKVVPLGKVEPKLRRLGDVGFEQREEVYEEFREEIMCHIRDSKKQIKFVVRGFYDDPRHIENMFKYLTKISLSQTVEERFVMQMDHLEAYLREMIQTSEFYEFMENLEIRCYTEFEGSDLYKWINLLRRAGDHFDGDGAMFMRLENDGPTSWDGPFILAKQVDR